MEYTSALQPGSTLQGGEYVIEKVLGQGATGITYLASMKHNLKGNLGVMQTHVEVAIKEFFMEENNQRDTATNDVMVPNMSSTGKVEKFQQAFVHEAQRLSHLDHPHIVHVSGIFNEHNTVYYVMQYLRLGSFSDLLSDFGAVNEKDALKWGLQVASALRYMHNEKKMCHYDLKPGNIMLSSERNAMLIDFGIAKNYDDNGQETSTTPPGRTKGFAPIEQYSSISSFSPKIDVYSFGATLYNLLTGNVPEESIMRASTRKGIGPCPKNVSQEMWDIIEAAMAIQQNERPTMDEIYARLERLNGVNDDLNPGSASGTGNNNHKTVYEDDKPGKDQSYGTTYDDDLDPSDPEKPEGPAKPNNPPKPSDPVKPKKDDLDEINVIGKSNNTLIYIIVCVVVLAIVGVGSFFLVKHLRSTGSSQPTDSVAVEYPEVPINDANGQQTMTFKGAVVNGLPSGKGVLTYIVDEQKDHYEGNFVNGKCEDKAGAMFYRNGDVYRGGFVGGHMTTGTYYKKSNGEYFEGQFQNDKPWKGYWFDLHNNVVAQVESGVEI